MTELKIRPAIAADLPEMLRVITSSFSPWPQFKTGVSALDHLTWKLGPGGIDDIGEHTVVELDGRVVASRLRWISHAQVAGQEFVTEMGADLAVDPAYQGRGIAREMTTYREAWEEDHGHLNFGTPTQHMLRDRGDEEARHFHLLTVWQRYSGIGALVAARPRRRAVARVLGAAARTTRAIARRSPRTGRSVTITDLDRFDSATDRLWERAREQFDIAAVRTAPYLNWRHCDARGGATTVLAAMEGQRCLGYAVSKPAENVANVVDLLADPDRLDVIEPLLAAAAGRMKARGCGTLACWLPPGHVYESALRASGFVATGEGAFTFANGQRLSGPPEVAALAVHPATRYHVTLGDFDFV